MENIDSSFVEKKRYIYSLTFTISWPVMCLPTLYNPFINSAMPLIKIVLPLATILGGAVFCYIL